MNYEEIGKTFLSTPLYDKNVGAYRSFYSPVRIGPIYPEITAYGINLSCIFFKRTKNKRFLERAKVCASYLMNLSKNAGIRGPLDNILYTFDTGIYISGLFDLYDISKNIVYLRAAEKSLEWLCNLFDGKKFLAIEENITGEWDKEPSVHLTKLAIPLLKASIYLHDEKYTEICLKLLRWAKNLQTTSGRFVINEKDDSTMLHPHCYAIEGFLFAYHHMEKKWMLNVVEKASRWLRNIQNKDGSFPRWYPNHSSKSFKSKVFKLLFKEKPLDVCAQTLRIWKILGENSENIKKLETYLKKNSYGVELPLLNYKSLGFEWKRREIYSWPTFFYMHALMIPHNDIKYASELF